MTDDVIVSGKEEKSAQEYRRTFGDRFAEGMVTSRISIEAAPEAIVSGKSIELNATDLLERHVKILAIDEDLFVSVAPIDELACLIDDHDFDVHTFGPSADFLLNILAVSAQLFAIADWVHELALTSSCWCGKKSRRNARVLNGVVARDGTHYVTSDVSEEIVHYRVLCRTHYRLGQLGSDR